MKKSFFEVAQEIDELRGAETQTESIIADYITANKIVLNVGDQFVSATPIGKGDVLVRVINGCGVPYSLIYSAESITKGLTEDASAPTTDEKGLVRWWLESRGVSK